MRIRAKRAERPDRSPTILRADTFTAVFDQNQIVIITERHQPVEVRRTPQHMNHNHPDGLLGEEFRGVGRTHRQGVRVAVDKDRHEAQLHERPDGRRPGERGHEHLIARLPQRLTIRRTEQRFDGQQIRAGPRIHHHGVTRAHVRREVLLKLFDGRAHRVTPTAERLNGGLNRGRTDTVGRRQRIDHTSASWVCGVSRSATKRIEVPAAWQAARTSGSS